MVVLGVKNSPVIGPHTLTLSTAHQGGASLTFDLTAHTAVGSPLLQVGSETAAGTGTSYSISFKANGAIPSSSFANLSGVTLAAPAGTVWPSGGADYIFLDDTTGLSTGGYGDVSGSKVVVVPGSGDGFWGAPGDEVTVVANGVSNPDHLGAETLQISTGGDPAAVTATYVLAAGAVVGNPVVQLLSPLTRSSKGLTYSLSFRTTCALESDYSTIALSFPAGTALPPGTGDSDGFTEYDDTTGQSSSVAARITGTTAVVDAIQAAAGDQITMIVAPTAIAGAGRRVLHLSTSCDPVRLSEDLDLP
jgi:hypothetical protein